MSTITYVIQVYGGCSGYLLAALQVLQNRAARFITRLPWMTPTCTLLKQCGWLSIKQLVEYHSLVLLFKVKVDRRPTYIYKRIGDSVFSNSRQEFHRVKSRQLKDSRNMKSSTSNHSFIPRTIDQWNRLPQEIRNIDDLKMFKCQLRSWIEIHTPLQ